jgi:N-acetylneuraminate synthase
MKIGNRNIGPGEPAYIIAEAGTAHAGNIKTAIQFVEAAKNAGADAIKFQMFTPREELFCPMEGDEGRWAWWNKSMLTLDEWKAIKKHADDLGIQFFASVFQKTGIEWGKELEFPVWKVASRAWDSFLYDLVEGPFIVSGLPEIIERSDYEDDDVIFLECCSLYPTPIEDAKWRGLLDGLSDHSGTIFPALDAMARGASVIEVHIKLNDNGPDAESSITPYNLKQICEARDAFAIMRQG